jgi:hypothetical protein
VADQNRREELIGEHAAPAVKGTRNRCAVESVGDCLPDEELVHRRDLLVDADIADVARRSIEQLQPRIAPYPVRGTYQGFVEGMDPASFQCL